MNKIKKVVSFDICREIIYITSFKMLRDLLWWSPEDIMQFIINFKSDIINLIAKLPQLEPNAAIKMICS